MEISVEIQQLDELVAKFKLAPALATVEIKKALDKAIRFLQAESRKKTPVGKTGFLRAHQPVIPVSPLARKLDIKEDYAIFVHDGTRKMRSRPWLRDVVKTKSSMVNQFFDTALKNLVTAISK